LFFEYERLLKRINPRYFLLENVIMKKQSEAVISDRVGAKPIMINSSLVSAQHRRRLYWTNVAIIQPADRGIVLSDILESGAVNRDKSFCIDASYFKGGNLDRYFRKNSRQLVFFVNRDKAYSLTSSYRFSNNAKWYFDKRRHQLVFCGTELDRDNFSKLSNDGIVGLCNDGLLGYRKLTPIECERLQAFADGYTANISNTQRYKCLGNSFTVSVVEHILKAMDL